MGYKTQVVLGLGSNLGDSRTIILQAVKALGEILTDVRSAPLYKTAPLYVEDQEPFINTVVAGFYEGEGDQAGSMELADLARELLSLLHEIEARFGRNRALEKRWGERFLDIDILLFGDLTLAESSLVIPHPRLKERRFALQPLLDILPCALEPGTGLSYRGVCESLPDQGVARFLDHSILSESSRSKAQ